MMTAHAAEETSARWWSGGALSEWKAVRSFAPLSRGDADGRAAVPGGRRFRDQPMERRRRSTTSTQPTAPATASGHNSHDHEGGAPPEIAQARVNSV